MQGTEVPKRREYGESRREGTLLGLIPASYILTNMEFPIMGVKSLELIGHTLRAMK